jgi:divalent metal cation (Fe/Co/Zn/Cd) transporter
MDARREWLRSAVRISAASVVSGAALGVTALVLAVTSSSLSLLGYGLDALVDSAASVLLVHRFRIEPLDPARGAHMERRAHQAISAVLIAGGLYVGIEAVRALASSSSPEHAAADVLVAALSVAVLPPLAVGKRRLATRLGSRALRADAVLTGVAAVLAAFVLIGVLLDRALGVTWADAAAALAIAVVLEVEGLRGVRESR